MKTKKEIKKRYEELKERARINGHLIWHRINPRLWGRLKEIEWVLE